MATKNPAAKNPAAKKPAAKKPAVKKSALKKKQGGTRANAGRKSIYSTRMIRVTIRIPEYQADHVLSKGKASSVIRDLIEEDITNERTN